MPKRSSTSKTKKNSVINLIAKDSYTEKDKLNISKKIAKMPLKTKDERKKLATAVTIPKNKSKQAGRKSKANDGDLITKAPRSFYGEREHQLLKHISTQLYFAIANHITSSGHIENIVEVEAMHLTYGDRSYLFICANETNASQYFKNILPADKKLKDIVTKTYKPKDTEGKIRSAKYSRKLASRFFGEEIKLPNCQNTHDKNQTQNIAALLQKSAQIVYINSNSKANILACLKKQSSIFFVDNSNQKYKERHAEETLTDIAEIMQKQAKVEKKYFHTSIFGKKRACMSCYGRMNGVIDNHSKDPGGLWLHTVKNQSPIVAKRTCQAALFNSSHVSINSQKKHTPAYDTASDSEAESESESSIESLTNQAALLKV